MILSSHIFDSPIGEFIRFITHKFKMFLYKKKAINYVNEFNSYRRRKFPLYNKIK